MKEALNELTTTLLLLPGPRTDSADYPFSLSDEARRQTLPVLLPLSLSFFSSSLPLSLPLALPLTISSIRVLSLSFARKEKPYKREKTKKRGRGQRRISLDLTLIPRCRRKEGALINSPLIFFVRVGIYVYQRLELDSRRFRDTVRKSISCPSHLLFFHQRVYSTNLKIPLRFLPE